MIVVNITVLLISRCLLPPHLHHHRPKRVILEVFVLVLLEEVCRVWKNKNCNNVLKNAGEM